MRRTVTARNASRGTVLAGRVEVGDSLVARFLGLMGRRTLDEGSGLWLPSTNGIHMMFVPFAIDAVFLGRPDGSGGRAVVSLHRGLPSWRGLVPLVRGAHGVLELPVGAIDRTRTVVGDRIVMDAIGDAAGG